LPFIVHAAEGIDQESTHEIRRLDEMQLLSSRTVVVHGLACTRDAVELINARGAAVVLCPTSNDFLFHRRPELALIRSLRSTALGSDSPLTSAGDLLDEIRYTHDQIGADAATLYRMVTTEAARILRLRRGEGTLAPGATADILVLRDSGLTPAEALLQMTFANLHAVILAGRVQLASPEFLRRLPSRVIRQLEPLEVDGHLLWVRAPIRALAKTAQHFLGSDVTLGGKKVRYEPAA
jgi:cytosine/adenosine deaminase-related metal-dependent hydrolase